MQIKATGRLSQLNDEELFEFISEGMAHLYLNAAQIESDAFRLHEQGRVRGARILHLFAEEEAAKFLILMDLVRCKKPSKEFSRQSNYFYDHLAKRIYAWSCISRQSLFLHVREYVEFTRREPFLDEMSKTYRSYNDQNSDERESTLYVDCIEDNDELMWVTPLNIDKIFERHGLPDPNSILLIGAFHYSGFTSPAALQIIADRWRKVVITDDYDHTMLKTTIEGTIEDLRRANLLTAESEDHLQIIRDLWFFPLYGLNLKRMNIKDANSLENPIRNEM